MRDALIEEYTGYTKTIAINHCKYMGIPYQDWDDYMQIALEALTLAASRFDPNHPSGASFKTWVVNYIRGFLKKYGNIGEGWHKDHKCQADATMAVPINLCEFNDGNGPIRGVHEDGTESAIWAKEIVGRVGDRRGIEILVRRYGHDDQIKEIAADMGLTYQWVQQLKERALTKLWRSWKQDEFERRAA